jgi:hypothetical protein
VECGYVTTLFPHFIRHFLPGQVLNHGRGKR